MPTTAQGSYLPRFSEEERRLRDFPQVAARSGQRPCLLILTTAHLLTHTWPYPDSHTCQDPSQQPQTLLVTFALTHKAFQEQCCRPRVDPAGDSNIHTETQCFTGSLTQSPPDTAWSVCTQSLTTDMAHTAPLTRPNGHSRTDTRDRSGVHTISTLTGDTTGSHSPTPAPWASPSPQARSPGRSSPHRVSRKPGSSPRAVLPAPYSSATGWGPRGLGCTPVRPITGLGVEQLRVPPTPVPSTRKGAGGAVASPKGDHGHL